MTPQLQRLHDALLAAGEYGLDMREISAAYDGEVPANSRAMEKNRHSIVRLRNMLAASGGTVVSMLPGSKNTRYVMRGAVGVEIEAPIRPTGLCASLNIRPVSRIVTGDLGLGAAPGTVVSVAWLSCLDAARPQPSRDGIGGGA